MLTPSPEIVALLATFAPGFTAPTFRNALVLIYGTLLTSGPHTVTAALRVMGLATATNFGKYHRVLNRAQFSLWVVSRLLFLRLIETFVPPGMALWIPIDETLERRQGRQIGWKGWFRDAVRSTASKVATSLGIRWCVVGLLVEVPWSGRRWALPFLVVPVLSEKTCTRLGKRHRSGVEWAIVLIARIRRWVPDREIVLIGEGGYAAIRLIGACQRLGVTLVTRLRIDAKLYDAPSPQPKSKRGPKPKKGARQPNFAARLADPATEWKTVTIAWYGGERKSVEVTTGVALWHQPNHSPVEIRWVLVRYEETQERTRKILTKGAALMSSETTLTAEAIVEAFVARWNLEVTFEEIRRHLGFETQRQWSLKAIGRTTPCLFGLFSLVVVMAKALHPERLPVQQSAWYEKKEATFSDALMAVRKHLWSRLHYVNSTETGETCSIPRVVWDQLQDVLSRAA